MNSKIIASGILRALIVVVTAILVLFLFYKIQSVIIYLIVSLVLTLIGNPILDFLKRRLKFKHIFATITTLLFFILIISGIIMLFIPLIIDQGQNLALLNINEIEKNSLQLIQQISVFLESHNIDASKIMKEGNLISKFNLEFIPNFLNSLIGILSSFGMGIASVLFITFFFLKDRQLMVEGLKQLIPDNHESQILNSFNKINHLLSRYFIGLLLQLFIVFILYAIVLLFFGIENAIIIAFLCAILNIIPYIGPLIASILAAILTMMSNLGGDFQTQVFPLVIYVLVGFWIVQVIDNNVSQPLIFSKSVSSHPLEIFLVILIAGFLFGIVGMIIAVPTFTIIKVIAKEFFPENKIVLLLTKNI
ncbi:AI-2E family transporter [Flavobacterium luteum]|uniref:AI-2E family transporter n=2 Tax=Flavobacterium luteum TaxID=2026654 RepID=A0A7J5AJ39_9FLAO|nr:AI-2E family transporter [Flavobacterium luteum]